MGSIVVGVGMGGGIGDSSFLTKAHLISISNHSANLGIKAIQSSMLDLPLNYNFSDTSIVLLQAYRTPIAKSSTPLTYTLPSSSPLILSHLNIPHPTTISAFQPSPSPSTINKIKGGCKLLQPSPPLNDDGPTVNAAPVASSANPRTVAHRSRPAAGGR